MKLTLDNIPTGDPDCIAARNADQGFFNRITTESQKAECRFALRNYLDALQRYPHKADEIRPKIEELQHLLETAEV